MDANTARETLFRNLFNEIDNVINFAVDHNEVDAEYVIKRSWFNKANGRVRLKEYLEEKNFKTDFYDQLVVTISWNWEDEEKSFGDY
jgi:adenylate kinase family enzyme